MKLEEYSKYDGIGLAELVSRKEVTAKELKDTALEGIAKVNPVLNAIVKSLPEEAEREIAGELPNGPFRGVPFLIKEVLLHAAGIPLSMGSRFAQGYVKAYDSELMARFRKAGLVTVGTTTTPEFAMSVTTDSVLQGPTRNPWNTERMPGGSSGGASAAVAAGIVPFAHANDLGGSIRIPASCNGLFGLKPTRGRTPTGPDAGELFHGLFVEFAVTRTVRDAAALLDAVAGPDVGCHSWAEPSKRPYIEDVYHPPKRLRIAWMEKPVYDGVDVDPEVVRVLHDTVRLCEDLGHELVEATPKIDGRRHLLGKERIYGANLARMIDDLAVVLDRNPSEDNLERATWLAYQLGKNLSATDLLEALEINTQVERTLGQFFTEYDVLLSPTLARPPLRIGEVNANAPVVDEEQWEYKKIFFAPYTYLFNTTGQPAMTVPLGSSSDGLPIGMQFAGRFADEATLFQLAGQLELARPWAGKRPIVHV
jgi:amidase